MPSLFNEAHFPVKRHGRFIPRTNQQLNLVCGRLLLRPCKQVSKQALSVTFPPVTQVNAHVQA